MTFQVCFCRITASQMQAHFRRSGNAANVRVSFRQGSGRCACFACSLASLNVENFKALKALARVVEPGRNLLLQMDTCSMVKILRKRAALAVTLSSCYA